MKILHFIPDINTVAGSNIFQYKPALLSSMSESADVHLLTLRQAHEPSGKITVHTCSGLGLLCNFGHTSLDKLMSDFKPDIVHIHACWSITAYKIHRWCVKSRIPVVITVDRQLDPWHVRHHYWLCKLPKLLLFQRYMIRHADAIHAVTAQEEKYLLHLGWHPKVTPRSVLNGKIDLVRIFGQVSSMSAKDMSGALIKLYRKVLDSRPFMAMTENDNKAEDLLLAAGMSNGKAEINISDDEKSMLRSLDINSWRRILLHSADEGIIDIVRNGCNRCDVTPPPVDVEAAERFSRDKIHPEDDKTDFSGKTFHRLLTDKKLSGIELDICTMLVSLLSKIKSSQVKRTDFANLYKALRFNEYNETLLAEKIYEYKIGKTTARLFQILKERYGLGEGFMFLEPLSDRKTRKLKKNLFKSDIQ